MGQFSVKERHLRILQSAPHPTVFVVVISFCAVSQAHADKIFLAGDAQYGTIYRCNLDGTDVEILFVGSRQLPAGGRIALDPRAGKMYWGGGTKRANLDGTNVETISTVGGEAFALDVLRGRIYWLRGLGGYTYRIKRANLDGTSVAEIATLNLGPFVVITGIGADPFNEILYLAAAGGLWRLGFDGMNLEQLTSVGAFDEAEVEIDSIAGKVYWVAALNHRISRANLDGTGVEDIITGLQAPSAIALDRARGKIYWTEGFRGTVHRANLNGTQAEIVLTVATPALPVLSGIALDLECGNLSVDAGETCDIGIPPGQPGTCLVSCDDGDPCTAGRPIANCTTPCEFVPVTVPIDGDGCCPQGFSINEDDDCVLPVIPAVSHWGLVVTTLILLIGAKVLFSRASQPLGG